MLQRFKCQLKDKHYSVAFIEHLSDTIGQNANIRTFQEIYELISRESELVTSGFAGSDAATDIIEHRNPLCFESLRDYFHRMIQGLHNKSGNDIVRFKEDLKIAAKELVQILSGSSARIVRNSEQLLCDVNKVMTYSYSKSVAQSVKKLAKSLGGALEVYICRSGALQEGIKLYQELAMDGICCQLIAENEVGYYISDVDCVLVGAEVVLQNGAIVNRAGTYTVALLAQLANRPVYVFAESYKFARKTYLSHKDIPYAIHHDSKGKCVSVDLTPSKYISMFCMENGLFTPEVVSYELARIFA